MDLSDMIKIFFIVWIFYSFLKMFNIDITGLISILLNRRRKFKDNDPDIMIRLKNLYVRSAKLQDASKIKTVEFIGDKYTPELNGGRFIGCIYDQRIASVIFKPRVLSRSVWLPIPHEYIKSNHSRRLQIMANGWKPYGMGIFALPVLRNEDKEKEEQVYSQIRNWINNTLKKEQESLTLERAVHNAVIAPGTDEISAAVLMQEEYQSDGQQYQRQEAPA